MLVYADVRERPFLGQPIIVAIGLSNDDRLERNSPFPLKSIQNNVLSKGALGRVLS